MNLFHNVDCALFRMYFLLRIMKRIVILSYSVWTTWVLVFKHRHSAGTYHYVHMYHLRSTKSVDQGVHSKKLALQKKQKKYGCVHTTETCHRIHKASTGHHKWPLYWQLQMLTRVNSTPVRLVLCCNGTRIQLLTELFHNDSLLQKHVSLYL